MDAANCLLIQISSHPVPQRKIEAIIWELLYFLSPNPNPVLVCPHPFFILSPFKDLIFHLCSGSHFFPSFILSIISSLLSLKISLSASSLPLTFKYAFKKINPDPIYSLQHLPSPPNFQRMSIFSVFFHLPPSRCSTHSKYSCYSHKSITHYVPIYDLHVHKPMGIFQ